MTEVIVVALVVIGGYFILRGLRARADVGPKASVNPTELAETLEWREGDASPNGRRVLWVQPAARQLLSMTQGDGAPWFAAGCPIETETLDGRLPENSVERDVDWPIAESDSMSLIVGFGPEVMEDKWRIVGWPGEKSIRLYFFRSWTGVLIYVLEVEGGTVRKIWAAGDDALAEPMSKALLDGHILGKACVVPAPAELGEDKLKLMLHGIQWAGRRCDAVEPAVTGAKPDEPAG
jgi:hypothetical protein